MNGARRIRSGKLIYPTFDSTASIMQVKYILFVIDVYTRYLWTLPLKEKKAESIAQALENLFSDTGRVPGYIVTDAGGEFRGGAEQKLLKEFNIGYFNLYSKNKAVIVERVQRTIKECMHRFFTRHNTYKCVDVLQDLTTSYNNCTSVD